jgi:ferredoxin
MTTEYRIRLDRDACEGVFACLIRDDRFVEGSDGLAALDADASATAEGERRDGGRTERDAEGDRLVAFTDDRLEDARQAARACPVDAIEVDVSMEEDDE